MHDSTQVPLTIIDGEEPGAWRHRLSKGCADLEGEVLAWLGLPQAAMKCCFAKTHYRDPLGNSQVILDLGWTYLKLTFAVTV